MSAIAEPLVVDPEAARPRRPSVDDHHTDVRARLRLVQRVPLDRAERGDAHTGDPKAVEVLLRQILRSERVVQEEDAHAGLRAIDEDRLERIRHRAGLAVVELERDRLAGGTQVVEQAGVRLIAVDRDEHLIARGEVRLGEQLHRSAEQGVAHRRRLALAERAHVLERGPARGIQDPDEREHRENHTQHDQRNGLHGP